MADLLQFAVWNFGSWNPEHSVYTPVQCSPCAQKSVSSTTKMKKTKNDWRCLEQHSVKLLQTARQYAGLGTVCSTEKYVKKLNRIGYRKNARYCCGQRKQYMLMLGWSMSIEKNF